MQNSAKILNKKKLTDIKIFIFILAVYVYIFVIIEIKYNMPKIIFEINYNIYPGKRGEYLGIINELKKNIMENPGNNYSVYENKKNSNNFSEIYICNNEDEFDALEDNQSEKVVQITQRLFDEFIKDKKVVYSTKYEV